MNKRKKIYSVFSFLLAGTLCLSMAACGGDGGEPFAPGQSGASERPDEENGDKPDTPALGDSGRYLVLYASRTGNTERVAQRIQATLDCDMLEVEPQEPYDNDYNAMLERAQEELAAIRQGNFPPVKNLDGKFRRLRHRVRRLSDLVRQHGDTDADVPAHPCLETCRKTNRPVCHQRQQRHFRFGQRGPQSLPRCDDHRPNPVADF